MEMESAVLEVPGISETAIIGVPDGIKGEVPVCFARLSEGVQESEALKEAIRGRIVEQIGKIAVPKAILFTEILPKTVSGKIMRRLLKEIVVKGAATGDMTGLEDPAAVAQIEQLVAARGLKK
jgi:acetyl-CoA synthetase